MSWKTSAEWQIKQIGPETDETIHTSVSILSQ